MYLQLNKWYIGFDNCLLETLTSWCFYILALASAVSRIYSSKTFLLKKILPMTQKKIYRLFCKMIFESKVGIYIIVAPSWIYLFMIPMDSFVKKHRKVHYLISRKEAKKQIHNSNYSIRSHLVCERKLHVLKSFQGLPSGEILRLKLVNKLKQWYLS